MTLIIMQDQYVLGDNILDFYLMALGVVRPRKID